MTKFYRIIYTIAAPIIHFLFPCRTVGLEHFPEGGALLCANHSSGWDPIVIALNLPKNARLTVMAKDQLFRIPLLGFFLKKLGILRTTTRLSHSQGTVELLEREERPDKPI